MLSQAEREALYPLIYRHAHGAFSSADELALRRIVSKDYPDQARRLDGDALMSMAQIMVAVSSIVEEQDAEAQT